MFEFDTAIVLRTKSQLGCRGPYRSTVWKPPPLDGRAVTNCAMLSRKKVQCKSSAVKRIRNRREALAKAFRRNSKLDPERDSWGRSDPSGWPSSAHHLLEFRLAARSREDRSNDRRPHHRKTSAMFAKQNKLMNEEPQQRHIILRDG